MAPSSARLIVSALRRVCGTRHVVLGCIALAFGAKAANAQIPSVDSLKLVLKRATYVFEGVVQAWNAVADPSLMATPNTAKVHVTGVFSCPVPVGEFGNEDVTIRYPDPSVAPAGSTAWFLGVGWSIGDHIATTVLSIVRTPTRALADTLVSKLRTAIHLSAQDELQAEASAADTIVIATIRSVSRPLLPHAGGRTEHEELWSSVRLTVDSIRGFQQSGSGRNAPQVVGWVVPPASAANMTILAPAVIGYDTAATSSLVPGVQRLLLLDRASRRPNLQNVDSMATAFLPKRANIHDVHDIALLGTILPNPVFGLEPTHECTQPFR
jgi:hypothetical protein